jgi:hypothetical protein
MQQSSWSSLIGRPQIVPVRGVLSHRGLRKDNPEVRVITGFCCSPGIADKGIAACRTAWQKCRLEKRLQVKIKLLKGPIDPAAQGLQMVPRFSIYHRISPYFSHGCASRRLSSAVHVSPTANAVPLFPRAAASREDVLHGQGMRAQHRGMPHILRPVPHVLVPVTSP